MASWILRPALHAVCVCFSHIFPSQSTIHDYVPWLPACPAAATRMHSPVRCRPVLLPHYVGLAPPYVGLAPPYVGLSPPYVGLTPPYVGSRLCWQCLCGRYHHVLYWRMLLRSYVLVGAIGRLSIKFCGVASYKKIGCFETLELR